MCQNSKHMLREVLYTDDLTMMAENENELQNTLPEMASHFSGGKLCKDGESSREMHWVVLTKAAAYGR